MSKKDLFLLFGALPLGIVIVVMFTMRHTSAPELAAPAFEESSSSNTPSSPATLIDGDLPEPAFAAPSSKPSTASPVGSARNDPASTGKPPGAPAAPPSDIAAQSSAFPTEERIWTDLSGKIMLASALHYDAERNAILLRNNKGRLFPNYAISNLSAVDRKFLERLLKRESRSKN